ncbi:MAG: PEGA domain-containing protein [Spirochaetales bacterium]|nr:PEGA domain-containing protein [Spirochaetales bacterium]
MKKTHYIIIAFIVLSINRLYGDSSFFGYRDEKTAANLDSLFVCNIGILNLQYIGNINAVNPIDADNAIASLRNILGEIPTMKFTKKAAILKAIRFYNYKNNPNNDKSKIDNDLYLSEQALMFTSSQRRIENRFVTEVYNKFKNDTNLSNICRLWFENYENPYYTPVIGDTITRSLKELKDICDTAKTTRGSLDYLFHGDIESIDQMYIINMRVYSRLIDADIAEFQVVSDSEHLTETLREEFINQSPKIFNIRYASLDVQTEDEESSIFLGNKYLGKQATHTDFIVPGSYILTVSKSDHEDAKMNITLSDYEHKSIKAEIGKLKPLQTVNFYIEPLGSKIFINSVYRGVTPLKIALQPGEYMISVKNELYESIRYNLTIKEVTNEETNVVFHLKSKNLDNQFKLKRTLYYVSFWNFTFSLVAAIPSLVFAYEYFYRYSAANSAYRATNATTPFNDTDEGKELYAIQTGLYAATAVLLAYAAIGLGWMFFSLFDYLKIMEKKDFIPILDFYKNEDGQNIFSVGAVIRLKIS